MKHWEGRDRDLALPTRRSPRSGLSDIFKAPVQPRRQPAQVHSLIGLAITLTMLIFLAWALAPSDPVSPALMN
jgi:hypothetical protein